MKIENQNTLKNALKNGINLFTGAGFSVNSKNKDGEKLPTGNQLKYKIIEHLKYHKKYEALPLDKLINLINQKQPDQLNKFLDNTFKVVSLDDRYYSLININIDSIFTTNIDDLTYRIFEKSPDKFLNDCAFRGVNSSKFAIDYIPLHGCVKHNEPHYKFSTIDINAAYTRDRTTWDFLTWKLSSSPTLFWGYSFEDSGTIQAFAHAFSKQPIWINLVSPSDIEIDYFKSLGFYIIEGNTDELLDLIHEVASEIPIISMDTSSSMPKPHGLVPSSPIGLSISIEDFYKGTAPQWNLILSGQIPQTSQYQAVLEKVYSGDNYIITGIPACGKTTLMMQVASQLSTKKIKLFYESIPVERAHKIAKQLSKRPAVIFLDDLAGNLEAYLEFSRYENIQLIGAERESELSMINFILKDCSHTIYDISGINEDDMKVIYNKIPVGIRQDSLSIPKQHKEIPLSIYEFISSNVEYTSIKERYRNYISKLRANKSYLYTFLLVCYVHSCKTQLSMDMLYFFIKEYIDNYDEIYAITEGLGKIIWDAGLVQSEQPFIDDSQDFFIARSNIIAEEVLEIIDPKLLRNVIKKFYDNIPLMQIHNYQRFKFHAFDAKLMTKAFPSWEEGKEFYEYLFSLSKSPFVLQQGALYFKNKNKFKLSFEWIDKARNMFKKTNFSIQNTYAIILFEANINVEETAHKKEILEKSMNLLSICYAGSPKSWTT